jgi:hypothetical protein
VNAFPNPNNTEQTGMSLRDWFAGLAMQGELASQDSESIIESFELLASYAYEVADAMMKARDEDNQQV